MVAAFAILFLGVGQASAIEAVTNPQNVTTTSDDSGPGATATDTDGTDGSGVDASQTGGSTQGASEDGDGADSSTPGDSSDPKGSDDPAPKNAQAPPAARSLATLGDASPTQDAAPVVGVTKTLVNPGPFNPGDEFQYRIQYTCSSLTTACPNATITDTIPGTLSFVTNTTTGDPSTITYDSASKQLKVVFNSVVDANGTKGLIAGHNGQLLVTAKFPAGTPDGTTAHNCAVITADGAAQQQSCADAEALTTPSYGVSLVKKYGSPFTGETATSGVQGTHPTSTLSLNTTLGGNQNASSLTVTDPDAGQSTNNNPFDSFDLASINTMSLPAGIQAQIQVKSTGGYQTVGAYTNGQSVTFPGSSGIQASDVTGLQIVYTCVSAGPSCADGKIKAGTSLETKLVVKLRDTLRSNAAQAVKPGTIHNQAKVTASYPGKPDQTATDTADYTVVAQTARVTASKTISPSSAQAQSGADVTMTVGGKNAGNIAATGMTVTDPDPTSSATPFDHFTFKKFNALSLPSGVTAQVKVLVDGRWESLGSGLTNGQTPNLGSIAAADVKGVQYVYTGEIAAGTEIKNSFVTTLKDSTPAGNLNPANCAAVSMSTAAGDAGQDNACANFSVTAITKSITANKWFSPNSGVAHTSPETTVNLSGKNTSNVAISSFQLVDPGTGSDATFNSFDFTGFGKLNAPNGTTWKVEVFNGTSWQTVGTYAANATPPNADLPLAAGSVQGVRYTLMSGSIPANTDALSTSIDLKLRGTVRGGTTSIDSGSVKNCTTASSSGITDATACATYTVTAVSPGTGSGVKKNIAKGSVVQGSGDTTNVKLTGKNGANVSVGTLTLEDTSSAFWGSFALTGFGSTDRPAGTTLSVEVRTGTTWHNATVPGGSAASVTPTLPSGVTAADVNGVRYTWTGTVSADKELNANFTVKLRDAAAAGSVKNCVDQTYSGGLVTTAVTSQACDSITINAQSRTVEQKKSFSPSTGTIGQDPTTTATLSVKNTSNVPLDSIIVTDPDGTTTPFDKFDLTGFTSVSLPSGVQVKIEANDDSWKTVGTYTDGQSVSVPGTITLGNVTSVRLTFSGTGSNQIPANSSTMSVGVKLALRDTVRGTTTAVDTTVIKNCFATTTVPADAALSGDPCANYTPEAASPGVSAAKSWNPGSGIRDEQPDSTITIKGRNSGNVPVDALVLQDPATPGTVADTAFDSFTVTGFTGLVMPQGANQVQLDVLTADGAWHPGAPAASLPSGSTVNGVALADIVGLRATFSNSAGTKLPVVADASKTANVGIQVELRKTLRSTGAQIDVPPGASKDIDNVSSAWIVLDGRPGNPQTADAKYTITSGTVKVNPDKSLYPESQTPDTPTVNPNQTLIYQLQIKNEGTRNLVAPVILDKFDPAQLSYDPTQPYPSGQYQFVANGSSLTGTGMVVDSSTPGQVKFTFADGDYLAPGQTAYIRVVLTTKPGLAAGTMIDNTYGVTWDVTTNGAISCTKGASGSFDGTATWCTDDQPVKVQKAESMASLKQIKGDDIPFTNVAAPGGPCPTDGGYTYYPCIAHTHTGGVFDYKLNVTVSGNVAIKNARAIDVLPHVGDTGVILTGQPRSSEWTPTMYSAIDVTGLPAGATYTLYYATTYTPCTTPLSNTGGAWCGDWSATAPTDLSTVKSIGIDVKTADGSPLDPAATFTLHWKMLAPPVSPGVGAITWNSFAFTGEPIDGSGWLLAAEPRKVGIDLSNPSVTVNKTAIGGDGDFSFTLTGEGENGLPATVSTANGSGSYTWGPNGLTPGKTYTLSETSTAGWTSKFVACTGVTPLSSSDTSVTFVAAPNAQISCAFTNTKQPKITVKKSAIGDGGDFSFTLTPTAPAGDPMTKTVTVASGATESVNWNSEKLAAGDFTLTETAMGEWVSDFVSCTDGKGDPIGSTLSGGKTGVSFTAADGADITCAFTNTKRPGITVAKTAIGGAGSFDFTLTPKAPALSGGTKTLAVSDGGTATYTWGPDGLTPGGTYTLSEKAVPGWISTFEQCTGTDDAVKNADGSVTFTAAAGAAVVCAFTNTKQPTITVEKTTVGDDSGTFSFVLDGPGGSTKDVEVKDGSGTASWGPAGLEPGEYTLREDTSGDVEKQWISTFEQCTGTDDAVKNADGSVTFTAEAGADVSCAFTNTKRPTIEVKKNTIGGDGTFSFTLNADGTDVSTEAITTSHGSGSHSWGPEGLEPGKVYTLSEVEVSGWEAAFDSCTGVKPLGWTTSSVTFIAEAGVDISCSFTNTKTSVLAITGANYSGTETIALLLLGGGLVFLVVRRAMVIGGKRNRMN